MSMISYAQNFEDVILWRALKDVKNGFYIDVGANDPIIDSVTKWFSEQGWSGINVEPDGKYADLLQVDRPNDINLNIVVGEKNDKVIFFETKTRGWSTNNEFLAKEYARKNEIFLTKEIQCHTLQYVCDKYVKDKEINFLKIDVEGSEKSVLQGADFIKYRPWILVIEATKPNSPELSIEWEDFVIESGYRFIYFDGLNRFYLSKEKYGELRGYFQLPPNPFDDYVLYGVVKRAADNANLNLKIKEIDRSREQTEQRFEKEVFARDARIEDLEQKVNDLQSKIRSMEETISWKMIKPLRYVKNLWK